MLITNHISWPSCDCSTWRSTKAGWVVFRWPWPTPRDTSVDASSSTREHLDLKQVWSAEIRFEYLPFFRISLTGSTIDVETCFWLALFRIFSRILPSDLSTTASTNWMFSLFRPLLGNLSVFYKMIIDWTIKNKESYVFTTSIYDLVFQLTNL